MPIINTSKLRTSNYRSVYHYLAEYKQLEVPIIQRSYAWEFEQISNLYDDICQMLQEENFDSIENEENNIAIGQGIFYKNEGVTFIYDGQQRILTYILFCQAAANKLLDRYNSTGDDKDKKRIEELKKAYTVEKVNENAEEQRNCRITVQQRDRDALEYILGFSKIYPRKSNSLLMPAYKLIKSWLSNMKDEDLSRLHVILTKKIQMLILFAESDEGAEELFYSTNSTGKPLSISQLLHARVHQVFKNSKNLLDKWDNIYKKLNEKEKKIEKIDSYLLYSVQVEEFVITSAKVFTHINHILDNNNQKIQYMDKIILRLETLYELIYGNNSEFISINSIIAITAIKQIYPLFLALSEDLSNDKDIASKTIEILTYIILQNNIIRQSPGTTKHSLAVVLSNIISKNQDMFYGINKDADVYNKIIDKNVNFDNKTGKSLFMLCALHNNDSNTSLIFSKGTELEHIVPQKCERWCQAYPLWKKEIDRSPDGLIYSFGNFVLLSSKLNKENSNKIWEDKVDSEGKVVVKGKRSEIASKGFVGIFQAIFGDDLTNQSTITPDYITGRGEKIAKIFVEGIFKKFIKSDLDLSQHTNAPSNVVQ